MLAGTTLQGYTHTPLTRDELIPVFSESTSTCFGVLVDINTNISMSNLLGLNQRCNGTCYVTLFMFFISSDSGYEKCTCATRLVLYNVSSLILNEVH